MSRTALALDVERPELSEVRFTTTRKAADITAPAAKNNVFHWPLTGTYTLQPINLTTDFSETAHWDQVKYRLADCTYDPDWWSEVPDNPDPQKGGPADYFMTSVVKATNVALPAFSLLQKANTINVQLDTAMDAINFEQNNRLSVMASTAIQPANAAYCLRFRIDGRESYRRAALIDFSFGEFALRLNSDGEAQLWQSADFVSYGYVYSWRWAHTDQVHNRNHQIVIFPHCRHKIEFISSNGQRRPAQFGPGNHYRKGGIEQGNGLYEIPGEIIFAADGVTPQITAANYWNVAVSREFRPHFQVSRLTFSNGTNPESFFWDAPIDITNRTGVAFAPLVSLVATAEVDKNGGRVQWALRNPDTGDFFVSDGYSSRVQFAFGMQGKGDVAGPGLGSSATPELYNYVIDKPPLFLTVPRARYLSETSEQVLDHGESPESERLSVTTYDQGAYARFSERGDIPLELGDLDTGQLYFEGTAFQVSAGEARAETPEGLHIQAYGMIDNLLRMDWADTAPNFEIDPSDEQHRPYLIPEVIKICFEAAGVPREEVVIEQEEIYLKDFRLWHAPTAGNSGIGGGHQGGALELGRWWPQPGLPVHEFTDHLIRKVLGWHWVRSKADRKWHIYKRPDPQLAADAGRMHPVVEFYSDGHRQTDTSLPGYKHSDLKKELKRPTCTTIIAQAIINMAGVDNRADFNAILLNQVFPGQTTTDPLVEAGPKLVCFPAHNYKGWKNPQNPTPNVNHPDFLGKQRIKMLPMPNIASRDAAIWLLRRIYEDNCFGYLYRTFTADWGDAYTFNLRKWDMCLVNGQKHYIHRIEPKWGAGKPKRAHYTVSKFREDVRPPR